MVSRYLINFVLIQWNVRSVTCSIGWSNRNGKPGTTASPVTVGPQARTRGLGTVLKAFAACLTTVWIVNAGRALNWCENRVDLCTEREKEYIDAMAWKVARCAATRLSLVDSVSFAARSTAEGPLRLDL
jgi:hypothetical protein